MTLAETVNDINQKLLEGKRDVSDLVSTLSENKISANGRKVDDARRLERKRQINRLSAQRKRLRERDTIKLLTEKYNELSTKQKNLLVEREKLSCFLTLFKSRLPAGSTGTASIPTSQDTRQQQQQEAQIPQKQEHDGQVQMQLLKLLSTTGAISSQASISENNTNNVCQGNDSKASSGLLDLMNFIQAANVKNVCHSQETQTPSKSPNHSVEDLGLHDVSEMGEQLPPRKKQCLGNANNEVQVSTPAYVPCDLIANAGNKEMLAASFGTNALTQLQELKNSNQSLTMHAASQNGFRNDQLNFSQQLCQSLHGLTQNNSNAFMEKNAPKQFEENQYHNGTCSKMPPKTVIHTFKSNSCFSSPSTSSQGSIAEISNNPSANTAPANAVSLEPLSKSGLNQKRCQGLSEQNHIISNMILLHQYGALKKQEEEQRAEEQRSRTAKMDLNILETLQSLIANVKQATSNSNVFSVASGASGTSANPFESCDKERISAPLKHDKNSGNNPRQFEHSVNYLEQRNHQLSSHNPSQFPSTGAQQANHGASIMSFVSDGSSQHSSLNQVQLLLSLILNILKMQEHNKVNNTSSTSAPKSTPTPSPVFPVNEANQDMNSQAILLSVIQKQLESIAMQSHANGLSSIPLNFSTKSSTQSQLLHNSMQSFLQKDSQQSISNNAPLTEHQADTIQRFSHQSSTNSLHYSSITQHSATVQQDCVTAGYLAEEQQKQHLQFQLLSALILQQVNTANVTGQPGFQKQN